MRYSYYLTLLFGIFICTTQAQILTHEDSLSAGLQIRGTKATAISGYGEVFYQHDINNNTGMATLRRSVLFIGHRFSDKLTFFSEMELENAKIEGGKTGGEISMEQCFIKFDISRQVYINAGFFTPRIGMINENHLPTTFNGNDRPVLESTLLPATWREVGLSLYGSTRALPGFNYSLAVMNGLNAEGFNIEEGIKGGRAEGVNAQARQKAVIGSLLYYYGPWRLQASSYMGGSVGLDNKNADFLGLQTGAFGTPVFLDEANIQFRKKGWVIKAIATQVTIPDAYIINQAYANNTPEISRGAYIDISKDIWYKKYQGAKQFISFVRYEHINMNAKVPTNGIANPYYKQQHIFAGFTWLPNRGVGVKADYHYTNRGAFNTNLIVNPVPLATPYFTHQHQFNLGLCYSF
jgi:hypothetical protein